MVRGRDAGRRAAGGARRRALRKLPIPKVMSYQLADGGTTVHFVRPAHGLVALHGADIVPVTRLGLEAGRITHGHRFQGVTDIAIAAAPTPTQTALAAQGAGHRRLRRAPRRNRAPAARQRRRTRRLARRRVDDDAAARRSHRAGRAPERLRRRVRSRVPGGAAGMPDPDDAANQKYFPLLDAARQVDQQFLIVSNIRLADPANIVEGNERVVRPRLADARFFFDQDRKKPLESRVPQLARSSITTSSAPSSSASSACSACAAASRAQLGADRGTGRPRRAARQGRPADRHGRRIPRTAGRHGPLLRARTTAKTPAWPMAIEEHYRPRFAGDALPANESVACACAGRQAGDAGRPVRHRPAPDRRQGSVRAAPPCAGLVRMLMRAGAAAGIARTARASAAKRFQRANRPAYASTIDVITALSCSKLSASNGRRLSARSAATTAERSRSGALPRSPTG